MKKSKNKTLKEEGLLFEDIFTQADMEEILSSMDNFFEEITEFEFDIEEIVFDLEEVNFEYLFEEIVFE